MSDVEIQLNVPLPPQQAFAVFSEQMDTWWPRRGVFPYSFAPESTQPLHIRFEAGLGGRYYETFADGSEYVIGRTTAWEPPARLAYTWRDPVWPGETTIELRFSAREEGTVVDYRQSGFAAAGVPDLAAYYQIGCEQTLAAYIAHCRAIYKLQTLTSGLAGRE